MKNLSMKKTKTQKKSDFITTDLEYLKSPFHSMESRKIKDIRTTFADSQKLWHEKPLQLKWAFRRASRARSLKKDDLFGSKRSFVPLMRKNEKKTYIDRFINLIMCASFTKGAKKSGKKTLACKLFLNSLLHYKNQIFFFRTNKVREKVDSRSSNEFNASKASLCLHSLKQSEALLPKGQTAQATEGCNNSGIKQELKKILFDLQFNVETRKVRIGGAIYQVPSIINKSRQEGLAIRSLISCAANNKRADVQTFDSILSLELMATRHRESSSRQRRDQINKNALSNRAYARYRWW